MYIEIIWGVKNMHQNKILKELTRSIDIFASHEDFWLLLKT